MMLPRGRPPGPGTAEEKAAIRREKVRLNVKAYRERKKNALAAASQSPSPTGHSPSDSARSTLSSSDDHHNTTSEGQTSSEDESRQAVVRSVHYGTARSALSSSKPSRSSGDIIWSTPNNSHVYADTFLALFRKSFLPTKVYLPTENHDHSTLITPCSPWIMTAYNMAGRQKGGALKSGLLAIGLMLSSLNNSDNDLQVASLQMQRQAISQLRNDLVPVTLHRQKQRNYASVIEPYLSCLAVTMFELMQTGFSSAIVKHIKALNSLIELMYSDPHIDKARADLIMEDFGFLEMIFCLKFGFASILRHTRRRLGPRKLEQDGTGRLQSSTSVFGDVLDIVEDLPSLIVSMKEVQHNHASVDSCNRMQHIIRKLIRIEGDLNAWNIQFEGRYGSNMVKETFSPESPGNRGVRYRLRSYEHGAVSLSVSYFQLYALDANIEATTTLAQMRQPPRIVSEITQMDDTFPSDTVSSGSTPDNATSHDRQQAKPMDISMYNEKGFLQEQIETQRLKVRVLILNLLDLIEQFSDMADNVTGQSLMVCPCDKIRTIIQKEEERLHHDLHTIFSKGSSDATRMSTELKEMAEVSAAFRSVESKLRQSGFGSMHGG